MTTTSGIHGSRGCHNERDRYHNIHHSVFLSVCCVLPTPSVSALSSSGMLLCSTDSESVHGSSPRQQKYTVLLCELRVSCCCGVCTTYEVSSKRTMEYDYVRIHVSVWMSPLGTLSYTTTTNALYTLAQQYHIHWGECSYRYSVSCCEVTPTSITRELRLSVGCGALGLCSTDSSTTTTLYASTLQLTARVQAYNHHHALLNSTPCSSSEDLFRAMTQDYIPGSDPASSECGHSVDRGYSHPEALRSIPMGLQYLGP